MAKKTIITVATTGAWPKKENNPNVPMTPQEIANDVYDCWQAGAAVAHLHMRDDEGNGTMSTEKFRETVSLLRGQHPDCDIVLNLTTSGDLNATDETRQAHLKELRPEMGSYDCGSMNWQSSLGQILRFQASRSIPAYSGPALPGIWGDSGIGRN